MKRLDARVSLVACGLVAGVGLWLAMAATAHGRMPPQSIPIIVVNPTPTDCYSGPGCLDTSFGVSGKVSLDIGGIPQNSYANAVQTDGKVVVVGNSMYQSNPNAWDWVVARFNTDGTLDSGFGAGGIIKFHYQTSGLEQARSVAIQPDGKIVVAGWGSVGGVYYVAVRRLTGSGATDTTFGTGGTAMVSNNLFKGVLMDMALQSDGKILLVANPSALPQATVARLKTNGAIDTSFGVNGFRGVYFKNTTFQAWSLGLQSTGKIVVGGYVTSGTSSDFALSRLTSSGNLDSPFGNKGLATLDFLGQDDTAMSIAIAVDDSIVAAGSVNSCCSATGNTGLARFTANGAPSSSFGTGGRVVLDMHGGADRANDVTLQADGKILFSGTAFPSGTGEADGPTNPTFLIIGRLTSNGALDSSFGTGGVTETSFGFKDYGYAVSLSPNGTVTVTGRGHAASGDPYSNRWILARYFQ